MLEIQYIENIPVFFKNIPVFFHIDKAIFLVTLVLQYNYNNSTVVILLSSNFKLF